MEILILLGIVGTAGYIFGQYSKTKKPEKIIQRNNVVPSVKVNKPDVSSLSEEQEALFNKIENTNKHMFITGKAGTGKSRLLLHFKNNSKKKIVVVAPTGVAALNVGGQTINSLFKIPPSFIAKEGLKPIDYKTSMLLKNIDTVVIDEISMVRVDLMEAIDQRLRQARNSVIPFGGVQIIMFGDPYQLPPVVPDQELQKYFADIFGGYYFFNSHVWDKVDFEKNELEKIFRQNDDAFKDILNAIREGDTSENVLNSLNSKIYNATLPEGVITLATTNAGVNFINSTRLSQLQGKEYQYRAIVRGDLRESDFPTEEILRLKVGAQVMFVKNDKSKRWVNGSIGVIKSLSDNEIKVEVNRITFSVPQESWNKIKYFYNQDLKSVDEEVVSSFTQFPLRLAWAITIHKSQGQTFDSVAIDLGAGAFAHGQTYVALSRATTLERLYLTRGVLPEDIIVDRAVVEFMKK